MFAGAVAKQVLARQGIYVGAHISQIEFVGDASFLDEERQLTPELFRTLAAKEFPVLSDADGARMQSAILAAREQQDSVGGAIECAILGLEPVWGHLILAVMWRAFSKHMFAVPAVKGIAFGAGFDCTSMRGSQYNDRPYMDGDQVKTRTNFNGGVNGGITNGMPVVFEVAMRPRHPLPGRRIRSIWLEGKDAVIEIKGRHDPCVVHRAVPVIEAAAALAVCELLEGRISL